MNPSNPAIDINCVICPAPPLQAGWETNHLLILSVSCPRLLPLQGYRTQSSVLSHTHTYTYAYIYIYIYIYICIYIYMYCSIYVYVWGKTSQAQSGFWQNCFEVSFPLGRYFALLRFKNQPSFLSLSLSLYIYIYIYIYLLGGSISSLVHFGLNNIGLLCLHIFVFILSSRRIDVMISDENWLINLP